MQNIVIHPGQLTLSQLRDVHRQHIPISLSPDAHDAIHKAEEVVLDVIAENRTVYGINTGFGLLANTKIDVSELELLQRSIVLSHAAGIGKFMSEDVVRLLLLLKINSLARGYSGIRLQVIEALITLYSRARLKNSRFGENFFSTQRRTSFTQWYSSFYRFCTQRSVLRRKCT